MTAAMLRLTGYPDADELLTNDANALLLGMVLDQQIPMEKAFFGPYAIAERMGGTLDIAEIASAEPESFSKLFAAVPAVHRFPGSMAWRVQAVCRALVEQYGGRAENIWDGVQDGAELRRRIAALPGFGDQKSAIFVALLGKQYGVTPTGWREAAGHYGEEGSRLSVADVVDEETLTLVRAAKKAAKAAAAAK